MKVVNLGDKKQQELHAFKMQFDPDYFDALIDRLYTQSIGTDAWYESYKKRLLTKIQHPYKAPLEDWIKKQYIVEDIYPDIYDYSSLPITQELGTEDFKQWEQSMKDRGYITELKL